MEKKHKIVFIKNRQDDTPEWSERRPVKIWPNL